MANGKLFTGSISLTKLLAEAKKPHSAFYTGKDSNKYCNIKIWVNDEPDQFGNHVSIQLNGKNDTEDYKVYLGNLKSFEQKEPEQFNQNDAKEIADIEDDLPF